MRDEFDSQKERIRIHDCLTGVGVPSNREGIQELGWKLAQLAQAISVEFQFIGLTTERFSDLEPDLFETRPQSETLVVNSIFELHPILARPGSIEKLLATVKMIKPSILTVVEQEANHNGIVFLDRFNEALHYYSSLFDSLEDGVVIPSQDPVMSEVYLGKQILNVVAAEGTVGSNGTRRWLSGGNEWDPPGCRETK